MEEDWYTVEQQIRDRHTELWAAARIQSLTREHAPTERQPNSIGTLIIRLANWVWARARQWPPEPSRALASRPVATTHTESAAREGAPPWSKRLPEFRSGR
jgi:hypothetical protein